jgi:hypothetical protein
VIEVAIALAVLGLILGAVGMTVLRGNRAYGQGISNAAVEGQARRMLEQIRRAPIDGRSLEHRVDAARRARRLVANDRLRGARAIGPAGALVVGPVERLRLSYAAGEVDDGLDNNGKRTRGRVSPRAPARRGRRAGAGDRLRRFRPRIPRGRAAQTGADDNGNGLKDERGLCFTYDAATGMVGVRLTIERVVVRTDS